ncbi:hypothetical protein DB346_13730 [Verrucomicrobia bacterium LW23]|nr:hypothetical protein DB346_13730 [Verrucomicrobia bacterium LW23]
MKLLSSVRNLACLLAVAALTCAPAMPTHGQETTAPAPATESPAPPAPAPDPEKAKAKGKRKGKDDGLTKEIAGHDPNRMAAIETATEMSDEQKSKLQKAVDDYRFALDAAKNDNALSAQEKKAKSAEANKALDTAVNEIFTEEQRAKYVEYRKAREEAARAAREAKKKKKEEAAAEK